MEIGARTSLGFLAEPSAAAVRAGISRPVPCPFAAVDAEGEPKAVAAAAGLGFAIAGIDRLLPLACSAIEEVLRKLDAAASMVPLRVIVTSPEARPGLSERALETLVSRLSAKLAPSLKAREAKAVFSMLGRGNAGVAAAIHRVVHPAGPREDALTLVVGVDSHHHPDTLLWLEHERHFGPDARNPITPGEGAGCLVLASEGVRKQLRLTTRAVVAGVGLADEPCSPDDEAGSFGVGLARAIEQAVAGLQLPDEAVDTTYSDVNGERFRSEEWGFVALRIPSVFKALEYEAPATHWGDVGAASGALGAVLAVQSWARGYARGPRALVLGGSRNGARGAILLRAPREA